MKKISHFVLFSFFTVLTGCTTAGEPAPATTATDGTDTSTDVGTETDSGTDTGTDTDTSTDGDTADGDTTGTDTTPDGDTDTDTYVCPGVGVTTGSAVSWLQAWGIGDDNPLRTSGDACACPETGCPQQPCPWPNPMANHYVSFGAGTCSVEGDDIANCRILSLGQDYVPFRTAAGTFICTHDGERPQGAIIVDGDTDTDTTTDGDTTDTDTDSAHPADWCGNDDDCADANPCIDTFCGDNNRCVRNNSPNFTPCAGGNQMCINGVCETPPSCEDGNPCTIDEIGMDGHCMHYDAVSGIPCDDGVECTYLTSCQAGACVPHGFDNTLCEDGDPNTMNWCEDTGCNWRWMRNDDCNNGNICNDFWWDNTAGHCQFNIVLGRICPNGTCDASGICIAGNDPPVNTCDPWGAWILLGVGDYWWGYDLTGHDAGTNEQILHVTVAGYQGFETAHAVWATLTLAQFAAARCKDRCHVVRGQPRILRYHANGDIDAVCSTDGN